MAGRFYRIDKLHVYCMPTAEVANDPKGGPEEIEHGWIEDEGGLAAIDAVAAADGYDHRPRQLRALLARGARLCAARLEGAVVGWCLFEPVRQTTYQWLHIEGGEDWIFGLGEYVRPDQRGRRVGPGIIRFATRQFLVEGYRQSASVVAMDNRAAIRTHAFYGSGRIGWIAGLRLKSGHAVVLSDRGVQAGRYDARRPCVYSCRL